MVGSILEHLPERYSGTVCGTGQLREESRIDLSHARVLALRSLLDGLKMRQAHRPDIDPALLRDALQIALRAES